MTNLCPTCVAHGWNTSKAECHIAAHKWQMTFTSAVVMGVALVLLVDLGFWIYSLL